jgi:hypothetical protein
MALARRPRKPLGQLMMDKGLITHRQLSDALKAQKRVHEKVGRILVEMGFVSELEMLRTGAEQFGLPFPPCFLALFGRRRYDDEEATEASPQSDGTSP